ncbi:capsule biosynthesis protein [Rhodovulum sp. 12E13]|uniref:capsule biosynthesis protein n=1 Tax=Rhodovulum sp. 12E13 TaxID=2203891 RepID=UPI000E1A1F5E|nr:capsule biosynthesis protein [Rhodovulum sp. 12E13]RDC72193.1 capsule biosynthesis protein [Rhodovulum sp. 12E13]
MTTKPRVNRYRLRPDAPLVEGVDPVAVRRAALAEVDAGEARATGTGGPGTAQAATGGAHGEVSSAAEVESETEIARIRREGLTGRQLRMARRVAQRHGLAPTSDFDAVRLLRARGIDPFSRANMLSIMRPKGGEKDGAAGLPSPVARAPAPAVQPAMPGVKLPEERAGEIWQIQRDIARRRRRRMQLLAARLAAFVLLPTLIVGWYYAVVATPMYATHSEFVIQQADSPAGGGLGGLFQGTGLAVQQDSTTVQSYLQSRDAMLRLDRDQGFRDHFSQDWIDPLQRLDADASNEDAYDLYARNVQVAFDPTEGILKMEVIAAAPEASQRFSAALIGYAEEQVDNLTQRLREDQMSGAEEAFAAAEARVVEAQARVLDLQERLGVLDPASETGSLMQQITQFEIELRQKELERAQLLANERPNQARLAGVEGEIERLQALVGELRASMTESGGGEASLARVSGELRIAEADLATRQLLLQQAAQQLETARLEANRQVRYMAVGVSPVAPDEPTYPRAFENTLLAFLIFSGIYLMLSLTASVLREQVSA